MPTTPTFTPLDPETRWKQRYYFATLPDGTLKQKQTALYRKWTGMRARCTNPRSPAYRYYGGRGIKVDPAWDTFEAFVADMGPCPPGHTLDRIDTNGDYSPSNCRWATWSEQRSNQRPGLRLRPNSLRGRARAAGLPYMVVYLRHKVLGWPLKRALSTPVARRAVRNDRANGRARTHDDEGRLITGSRLYMEACRHAG